MNPQRRLVLGNRLRQPAGRLRQGVRQVVVGLHEIGLDLQSGFVFGNCLRQPVRIALQFQTQIVVRPGAVRNCRHGAGPQTAVALPIEVAGVGSRGERQADQSQRGPGKPPGSGPARPQPLAKRVDGRNRATGQPHRGQIQKPLRHDTPDEHDQVRSGHQREEKENQKEE